ncbi:ABC transporter substrate-binding protein [Vibrio breoganii]
MLKKTAVASLVVGLLTTGATFANTEIKQGGEITVPAIGTGFVENFNPYTQKDIVAGTMFEPLFIHNGKTGEIEPRIAESITQSEDLMTITIKVRPNLKWSDGKPLTAEDVAYSYTLTKDNKAFDVKGMWSGYTESVTATDDTTVVIKMAKADSTFLWGLKDYYIVPKHVWSEVENLTTFTNPNPVGNGPMTEVALMTPQQIKLCRNPHYWQAAEGRPYLDCITARSYNDNSQIQAALMKGEIDWASNFVADIDKTFVDRDPENNHYWYPANDAIQLYLNTKRAPLDDVNVRRALSMALDREDIVEFAAYGYPTANHYMGGLGQYFEAYVNQDVEKKFAKYSTYNFDEANRLLDEAGLKDTNGDGIRNMPNGENVEFDIEVVSGWTDWVQTVQMVSEYFEEVGVKANVKTVDWSVYDKNLKEGGYDISINWSNTNNAHPIQAYQDYFSASTKGQSWHAGHGVFSQEISDKIDAFTQTTDVKVQTEILNELQEFAAENVAFIPLFSNPTWFQYRTERVVGWPDAENPYIHPNYYQADKKVKILDHLHAK